MRYFVLPRFFQDIESGFSAFFESIIDDTISSLIIAVFIGSFLYFLRPETTKNASIEIVEPRGLPELFERAFLNSEIWWYKGGCGRYFRTKSLPEMASWARKTSSSREVKVIILDPLNVALCEAHAIFRKSTASAVHEQESWDLNKVRNELYATIVTTLIFQREEPLLRITLSLASHYSAFRIDLSDDYAIVTKEDRGAPAIVCYSKSYYYKSYKDEIILSEKQCKDVSRLQGGEYSLMKIAAQNVGEILEATNLKYEGMTSDVFEKIAELCRNQRNPYA